MRYRRSAAPAGAVRDRTREQLLAAAREVFAETGFHRATIREISRRAGANIAAVNYHFGDKEGLYAAVVLEAARVAREKYPEHFGLPPRPTPEQRLQAFVRSLLLRTLSSGPHAQHGKLLTRELIEPSPALDGIVRDDLQPMASSLLAIVRELLGRKAPPELVRNCGLSVAGQIFFLFHCRPVLNRLFPDMTYAEDDLERLAEHITRFSLAAIKKLASAGRPHR
jgi:TetR/AcrR family transcriptional regulator, regulator of cefoperazone and chloramphenicol sensitivity